MDFIKVHLPESAPQFVRLSVSGVFDAVFVYPGKTMSVPALMREEAIKQGCSIVTDDEGALLPNPLSSPANEPADILSEEDKQRVLDAFKVLKQDKPDNAFTTKGVPTRAAIQTESGVDLPQKELNALWEAYEADVTE